MDAVEDVKSRLSLEDVVGEYVELKRAGRNFKGLSPFNAERTPSFMVSPEKQIWHDFSSGKGGNMFSFVMEMEGVDFKGALEILARKAGLDLSLYGRGDSKMREKKDKALKALELATKYYQQSLLKNQSALNYVVKTRGFNKQTLTNFKLGYAPNTGAALTDFLTRRSFSEETIKLAGLGGKSARGNYDMFRSRVTIPLMDSQGAVIGFTARILSNEADAPKYINTPQTLLYDKSRHVFGLHLAKDAIRASGFAVVVEGNLDVLSTHQAGYSNVVATAGTAMTTQHLKTIGRFTSDIRLCFDQDRAGIAAAERAIAVAQGIGIQLSIITLPEGKDPDELVRKDAKKWEEAIHKHKYAVDWLIDRYQNIYDLKTARGKRAFSDVLLGTIARLEDQVEQDHYLLMLAEVTEVGEAAMRSKLEIFKGEKQAPLKKMKPSVELATSDPSLYQDQLLSLVVTYPLTRRFLQTESDRLIFSTPERQRVYEYLETNPHVSLNDEIPEDLKDVEDYVKILLFKAEELYGAFDANERLRELRDLVHRLTTEYQKQQKIELSAEIKAAEEADDEALVQKLLLQFNELLKKE
jgi:DNA primase